MKTRSARPERGGTPTRLLESALDLIGEGVVVVDQNGRFIFFNRTAREILGLGALETTPAEWSSVYGCYRSDMVTPYPSDELPLARALRGERAEDEFFICNSKTPEGAWIRVRGTPLTAGDGHLIGAAVVFQDVTARRITDQTVRRLSQAVEATADCVMITDARARIEYVNPAFVATTGYSREQVLGRPATILEGAEGAHGEGAQHLQEVAVRGGHCEVLHRRRTGEVFAAEDTVTPVRDSAGNLTHFVSVMRDVTGVRRAHAREAEMNLARMIQRRLYPLRAPVLPAFDLAGAVYPADATCGDYFDFVPMSGGRLGIAIGDVSGHGFGPALLMAETRAYLRSLARTTRDLPKIMERINSFLYRDTEPERFVTLMLVLLDPARRSLTYASAGHVPGFLLDSAGATRANLEATGIPLGVLRCARFEASPEILLGPGDLFILLTDGATEVVNDRGEWFEPERVLRVVSDLRRQPSRRIITGLHLAIEAFRSPGPRPDDVTAVVCRARFS